ncbi:DUF2252 domain-containing protein [Microbacterium sp. ZW T5_45]|uniref:DUF2252 domain-containing protein n=1 Tax=Microbacterium sp. ZW T5_45 TaxID=3378080 RepID=UPI003852050C
MDSDWAPPASRTTLRERGVAARKRTPRRSLAEQPEAARDPLGILEAQNRARQPDLVPLRVERMSASPFAFYRGTAALMAADLADAPHSGILVASCGDAHVSNFGFYASPQRSLVFDLNDFDEAAWAPWEWDVKRLVASIVIGGHASGRSDAVIDRAALSAVTAYARGIARTTALSPTKRYFAHFDVESTRGLLDKAAQKAIRRAVAQAQRRTGERAVNRLTEADADGRRRFRHQAPTTSPLHEELRDGVHDLVEQYRRTASPDVALLFEHYTVSDVARRVVGVGSVGTHCYLVLFQDGEDGTLLMQPKQASRSVLVEYGGITQPPALQRLIDEHGEGARVVSMQRILQALSDPFLGHLRSPNADYYARQFHDMKGSIEVEDLDDGPFITYAQACAAVVARAHSQSVTASEVAGYLGGGRSVATAILEWARRYAEVSLSDYESFRAAHSWAQAGS